MLTGLVANAREAQVPDAGPVRVATSLATLKDCDDLTGLWIEPPPASRLMVCLAIEDSGVGMAKEVLDKAFDPFFSTHRPGRGLGLSAALGILKAHNAGLWIRTAPGQGTTLRVFFPVPGETDPGTSPVVARVAVPAGSRGLLLVDDDNDLQETLGEFLRDHLGYRIYQARDGLEAVDVYRREQGAIGLILMDATMPKMNGPDAFRVIRELDANARAILCSGFAEEAGAQVAKEFGFEEFLKKPFTLRMLQEKVQRVLGRA